MSNQHCNSLWPSLLTLVSARALSFLKSALLGGAVQACGDCRKHAWGNASHGLCNNKEMGTITAHQSDAYPHVMAMTHRSGRVELGMARHYDQTGTHLDFRRNAARQEQEYPRHDEALLITI